MKLDSWQKEVLKTKGNMCLRSGRQVGKSTIIGIKAAKYALDNKDKLIMVISKTERQAGLLFNKILFNLSKIAHNEICTGKERPTKSLINLKNGSKIYCLPAGDTGFGIMGFTIDLLIADEAAFIPEEVWNSVIPALAVTKGSIWLLSTPVVKEGYYYQCFQDSTFTSFHTSTEDCPRADDEWLAHKKQQLTKAQYAQMYLGEFVDELRQFFPDKLIREVCCLKRRPAIVRGGVYYLGCDVARMDRDEFTYEVILKLSDSNSQHVESIVTKGVALTESARRIMELNKLYDFKYEFIDSGGMGIAVCDMLRESSADKYKVVEVNNASRSYEMMSKDHKTHIIKEDLYNNLKSLLQQGRLKLLDDDELKASLKSIQAEHDPQTGRMKIWGSYSHIAEGLIRAAWGLHERSQGMWFR